MLGILEVGAALGCPNARSTITLDGPRCAPKRPVFAAAGADGTLAHAARDSALNRGCGTQLVFVSFLIGTPEVGAGPGCPTARSTTAVAPDVPRNGKRTDLLLPSALVTLSERQRPEPRLRCSASVCIAPDRYSGG